MPNYKYVVYIVMNGKRGTPKVVDTEEEAELMVKNTKQILQDKGDVWYMVFNEDVKHPEDKPPRRHR